MKPEQFAFFFSTRRAPLVASAWSLLVIINTSFSTVVFGQDFGALEKTLRVSGYQLYNPPRANWGPGFVFAGEVTGNRIKNVEEICPNLYGNDSGPPQDATIALGDYKAEDSVGLGLSLQLLKGLLGIGLDFNRVVAERTVDIKWQDIHEVSYTHVDQWLKTGEPRPIAQPCRLAIDDLKAKNRFKDHTFVIVRAVAPQLLVYDFTRMAQVNGSAWVTYAQDFRAAMRGKPGIELKNETQLQVKQPLFVGYAAPFKIEQWLPTGLVSGEIVQVRGEPTNFVVE